MEENFTIQAGDILIVRGKELTSKLLSLSQKFFYLKNNASHVLIAISDGFYIHAIPEGGVQIIFIHDILDEFEDDWRAIRLKNLNEDNMEKLLKSVFYYKDQEYNYKYFTTQINASFCSELAAKIYLRAGIKIFNFNPKFVKPSNFAKEADKNENWEDITSKTKKVYSFLKTMPNIELFKINFYYLMAGISYKRKMRKMLHNMIFNTPNNVFSQRLKNMYDEELKKITMKKNIPYWDDIYKKEDLDDSNTSSQE